MVMERRHFLRVGAGAALGLSLPGCAPWAASPRGQGPVIQRVNLAPVRVSWDRIIRTTVGFRPYRDSGYLLRADRMDDRTVIHNYGHGGSGMSVSWGTGQIAAELALPHTSRRAAVIGCGVVGLTSARQLQRRGFDVTIYAASLPPYTTSNMSWAGFTPASGLVAAPNRTPEWDAQYRRAIEIAYRELHLLAGRGYGVTWIPSYSATNSPPGGGGGGGGGGGNTPAAPPIEPLLPTSVELGSELLGPGEHPFPTLYARRSPTLRFEPSIYLEALMRDVLAFGGRIVVRRFEEPRDLMALEEELIVNCTGLGSRELFGDPELTPVKGQLTVLVPQEEVTYSMGGMMPRSDGIVLGHVNLRGDESPEVNLEEQERVMANQIRTFSEMLPFDPRLPASRVVERLTPPPLEAFFGVNS